VQNSDHYKLKCTGCGWEASEDTQQVHCPTCGTNALLRAVYPASWEELKDSPGSSLSDFAAWLPVQEAPARWSEVNLSCYRSEKLGRKLGLRNLWVIFSGYWPEHNASLVSLSFKQLDAEVSARRIKERDGRIPLASSAGNLGLAIAQRSILHGNPAVVLIPDKAVHEMRVLGAPTSDCLCLVTVEDAVYGDVIALTNWVQKQLEDRLLKGSAVYNVATRGGHSVTFLNAVKTIGTLPDHYFQAVGSGTGAIAAWESVLRYNKSESSGKKTRLHLAQNFPFVPMVEAWRGDKLDASYSTDEARERLSKVKASVLSNNSPPFKTIGGIKDCLTESDGLMYSIKNAEIESAMQLFYETEGCDINPAAGAALAALRQAMDKRTVASDDVITLHITGGGSSMLAKDCQLHRLKPSLVISRGEERKALAFIRSFLSG
jgi:cysteate synthase